MEVSPAVELTSGITDPGRLTDLVGPALSSRDAHYLLSGNPQFVDRTAATIRRADPSTRWKFWRVHTDAFLGY